MWERQKPCFNLGLCVTSVFARVRTQGCHYLQLPSVPSVVIGTTYCFSFPMDIVLIYTTIIFMCSTLILQALFFRSHYKAKCSINLVKDCSCRPIAWTWTCGLPYQNTAGSCDLSSPPAWKPAVLKEQFKLPDKVIVHEMCKWHGASLISVLYSSNATTLHINSAPLLCQKHTFAGLMLAS